jgi:hypothetical protein
LNSLSGVKEEKSPQTALVLYPNPAPKPPAGGASQAKEKAIQHLQKIKA